VFFVARFSRPFASYTAFTDRPGGYVTFPDGGDVSMQAGISFVDWDGAAANLASEPVDFDHARADARAAWNRELARVRVTDPGSATELQLRSFYTALFHAQQHPNLFSDVDGRYLGFDHAVHVASGRLQYANFSSWDTYKAQNQLLATIQPARYRDILL
jgi:putative alpha-1,2-mannosidase